MDRVAVIGSLLEQRPVDVSVTPSRRPQARTCLRCTGSVQPEVHQLELAVPLESL